MPKLPDVNLLASVTTDNLRRVASNNSQDGGRRIDHMKRRSMSPEALASLLEAVESNALAPSASQILTGKDSNGKTVTYFILGWSKLNGTDVL